MAKHQGIFVHVTGIMQKTKWILSDGKTEVNPESISMADRLTLVQWLTERHIESIESVEYGKTRLLNAYWFGLKIGIGILTI